MRADLDTLMRFEEELRSEEGVTVSRLASWLEAFFKSARDPQDLDDYRLSKRPWKKLKEEISPVASFLRARALTGRVRFGLDNQIPDCWFMPDAGPSVGIEVTTSFGRAGYEVGRQLVEQGRSGGVIGFTPDHASRSDWSKIRTMPRRMFNSDEWLDAQHADILRRLEHKNDPKYAGLWLLVSVHHAAMPEHLINDLFSRLRSDPPSTPFAQVFCVDVEGNVPRADRIDEPLPKERSHESRL